MKHLMAFLFGFLALATAWSAAVPNQITYQGTLKEQGVPVEGTRFMQFRITNVNGSSCYWKSAQTAVPVTRGLFAAVLNPASPSTDAACSGLVDWQNVSPYIELSVAGQVLGPLQPITATAYSLMSANVIDGAITNPKIAPGAITGAQIANQTITGAQIAPAAITGSQVLDGAVTRAKVDTASFGSSGPGFVPVGGILPFGGSTAPPGFLLCDGSQKSRLTFSALFGVIGVSHGGGDGSTTFNVPDYQGRFLRGQDRGAGRDPNAGSRSAMNPGGNSGDAIGSVQGSATKMPGNPFATDSSGAHTHQYHRPLLGFGNQAGSNGVPWVIAAGEYKSTGNPEGTADGVHSHGIVGGDNESRPVNASVNYIIKY